MLGATYLDLKIPQIQTKEAGPVWHEISYKIRMATRLGQGIS